MKPWFGYDLNLVKDLKELARYTSIALKNLVDALNNNITFADNVRCSIVRDVQLTSGVELGITHSLNVVPTGFLVISKNANAVIYAGSSEWSETRIYLIASANVTADIIVLGG